MRAIVRQTHCHCVFCSINPGSSEQPVSIKQTKLIKSYFCWTWGFFCERGIKTSNHSLVTNEINEHEDDTLMIELRRSAPTQTEEEQSSRVRLPVKGGKRSAESRKVNKIKIGVIYGGGKGILMNVVVTRPGSCQLKQKTRCFVGNKCAPSRSWPAVPCHVRPSRRRALTHGWQINQSL